MDACRDETVHFLHRCLRRVNQGLQQFPLILRVHGEYVDEGQNLRYGRDGWRLSLSYWNGLRLACLLWDLRGFANPLRSRRMYTDLGRCPAQEDYIGTSNVDFIGQIHSLGPGRSQDRHG